MLPEERLYKQSFCEHEDLHISCDYGRPPVLEILRADWGGKLKPAVCPIDFNKQDINCVNNVTAKMKKRLFYK